MVINLSYERYCVVHALAGEAGGEGDGCGDRVSPLTTICGGDSLGSAEGVVAGEGILPDCSTNGENLGAAPFVRGEIEGEKRGRCEEVVDEEDEDVGDGVDIVVAADTAAAADNSPAAAAAAFHCEKKPGGRESGDGFSLEVFSV
jgi:hypothetical protein